MVYQKSTLGYNEFVSGKRTLSVRERQVLLLVNGVRNIDDLEKFFKKELLVETIQKLHSGGFIHLSNSQVITENSAQTILSFLNTPQTNTPINPIKIAAIKSILIEASDDYLGLMGRSIKERITHCNDEVELRNCMSSWHMAMRESKLGRESASFLMEQIHQTLENKILDAETSVNQAH